MIKSFVIFAVLLKVVSGAITATYICLDTGIQFDYSYEAGDPLKTTIFPDGHFTTACKATITPVAGAGSVSKTWLYNACGVPVKPSGTGLESIDYYVLTTIRSDGSASDSDDNRYKIVCEFKAGKPVNPDAVKTAQVEPLITQLNAAAAVPSITLDVYKASDTVNMAAVTDITLGEGYIIRATMVKDNFAETKLKACIASVVGAQPTDPKQTMLDNGCTPADSGGILPPNAKSQTSTVDGTDLVAVSPEFKAFLILASGTAGQSLEIECTLSVCASAGGACAPRSTCVQIIGRRRRSSDVDRNIEIKVNTTIIINEEPKQLLQNPGQEPCVGYTSNTVFYVVVLVLATLLVITIGVAAFFGSRARGHVVMAGKDNPVYG